jgi:hypothetical protein
MMQETDRTSTPRVSQSDVSYQDRLGTYRVGMQRDHARFRGLVARWSWIRVVAFAAGVVVVILFRQSPPLAALAAIGGFLVFMATVLRHTRWEDRRAFADRALTVAGESLHASTRRDSAARAWQRPEDPPEISVALPHVLDFGPTWPLTDQERDDLDLYGPPVGIFGLLNRTSTQVGARRLRDLLDAPGLSRDHIRGRQEAVRWLAAHHERRLEIMATLVSLRSQSKHLDRLIPLLHRTDYPARSALSKVVRLWSAVSGLLIVYAVLAIAAGQYAWGQPLLGLLLLNGVILAVVWPLFRRLGTVVTPWTAVKDTLDAFFVVARHASRELPDETQLRVLKGHFHEIAAHAHIPSLSTWLEWAGLHGVIRAVLNVMVFFDLHIAEAVLSRVVPNRNVLLCGLSSMAELEALCSLASFSAELPVACYPQPVEGTSLRVQDGRHPLILEQDVTPNSIHLDAETRTWVITGPNAAGKSTFVRMVGINVLLAQIGAAVGARQMTWSPVRLITNVRIRDDLARHESYFLSEVRRLRRLILDPGGDAPVFGLIDEPFRGTNSQERAAAGIALIEHLMASSNLFVIATHEETLARTAAQAASAQNFHFQEHLQDGGIAFDYLLRPGPAGTRTALRILEQEGYPKTLLERAKHLMTDGGQNAKND